MLHREICLDDEIMGEESDIVSMEGMLQSSELTVHPILHEAIYSKAQSIHGSILVLLGLYGDVFNGIYIEHVRC